MKTLQNYLDTVLGFPVRIAEAPVIHIGGEEIPDFDYQDLGDLVMKEMPLRPYRLTGREIRFVRLHMEETLAAFGERLGVSHVAVRKWEGAGPNPTGMSWGHEKLLRLAILAHCGRRISKRALEAQAPTGAFEPYEVSLPTAEKQTGAKSRCTSFRQKRSIPASPA